MPDKNPAVLELSGDAALLMRTAVDFAASGNEPDHRTLAYWLGSEEFLYRLDTPNEYLGPPRHLRLARVLRTLMENPAPSAGQVLVQLTQAGGFLALDPRQFLLIQALAVVRPATPSAVSFWDQNSQPDSCYLSVTISALADNGTYEALALLERKMAEPDIDDSLKISWMRRPILIHRNEAPMLESCARMLGGPMSQELRIPLVEALFDYQPQWYRSNPPAPPPLSTLDSRGRDILRGIGQYAFQSLPLEGSQISKIEFVLARI